MIDVWELMRWLMEDVEVMVVLMKVRAGLGKLLAGLFWLRMASSSFFRVCPQGKRISTPPFLISVLRRSSVKPVKWLASACLT
jgi:hypothetical protein